MCKEEELAGKHPVPQVQPPDTAPAGEGSAEDAPPDGEGEQTEVRTVLVDDKKPEGYEGSCLRPTGMCDLGGCCDVCWYSPEHPRFKNP